MTSFDHCDLKVVALVFALLPTIAHAEPLRLEAFLAEVDNTTPGIRAAQEHGTALSSRVTPAGTPEDPFFAAGPDDVSGGSGIVRYQLSQSIPVPSRLGARTAAATERAASAAADAQTVARTTIVLATQTFYRAFHNQQAVALNEDLGHLVNDAIESGRARYQTGSATHHEWLLAKAELGVLEVERVRLQNEGTVLRAELNELRGAAPAAVIDRIEADLGGTEKPEPSPGAPAAGSPEKQSLDAAVRAAEAERRLAKLAVLPDVVVQGMLEDPRDDMERTMWGVMVGVSLPVFWGWKQRDLVVAADRELRAAEDNAEAIRNRLAAEEAAARAEVENARRTVELYEKSVLPATDLALQSARSGYALGQVGLRDLIDVARARRAQELEHLDARIDVELAKTRLENLLSSPPVLRLAPVAPTLFGAGMAGTAGMGSSMRQPDAVRMGSGMGLGAARGADSESATPAGGGGMKGM